MLSSGFIFCRAAAVLLIILPLTFLLCACRETPVPAHHPPVIPTEQAPAIPTDETQFSKNFFAAFPMVRLEIDNAAGGKTPGSDLSPASAESLHFLFDTGNAGISLLDAALAQRLGLTTRPSGRIRFAGVILPALETTAARVRLFNEGSDNSVAPGPPLRNLKFQVIDLSAFSELAGRRVDGILGYDVIHRFVTTVDYSRQSVTFKTPAQAGEISSGIIVPFELRNNWIVVPVRLNDAIAEEMILDTGASITTFSDERAAMLGLGADNARLTTMLLPIGRVAWQPLRLRSVDFGETYQENVASVIVSTNGGLFASPSGVSLLGGNVLRRFRVTINYPTRQIILEKNAAFVEDENEYTSVGIIPLLRAGRFYVSGVINGSPADDEGITSGDEIVALSGRPASEFSFGQMMETLRGAEGSTLPLTFRRGQRIIELNLRRVRLL
jgi:predicted aspartyl protease